eukprot:TRINITY_DN10363_c0_g1_i2.p1 TRINITY_DN10363_c0_g1~~TRINITY_DN10363_c0_g1_i2.p1  ORF type:complete len:768 (-),score=129.95 TRINITY_DN10363_c0_g1_i2:18-2321(-)
MKFTLLCATFLLLTLSIRSSANVHETYQGLPSHFEGERVSKEIGIFIQTHSIVSRSSMATIYLNLAESLALENSVTILIDDELPVQIDSAEYSRVRAKNIPFVKIPSLDKKTEGSPLYIIRAYEIMDFLKDKSFDVLHFADWEGKAYYVTLAKMEGLAFENTEIVVGLQQPYIWGKLNNFERITETDSLGIDFMQRRSVELADVVISPSTFMLNWVSFKGWEMPRKALVQPNIVQLGSLPRKSSERSVLEISEFVFYGDLQPSSGLIFFCDAIDALADRLTGEDIRITFLGKEMDVQGVDALTYITIRSRRWDGFTISTLSEKTREEALAYLLSSSNRLAVVAPEQANAPLRIEEMIYLGVPFIASAVGGIPEMVTRSSLLFEPRPDKLAAKLIEAVQDGFVLYSVADIAPISAEDNTRAWLNFHQSVGQEPVLNILADTPLVSVCIVHHDRPGLLTQAVTSIEQQDYENIEVILVDDHSQTLEAQKAIAALKPVFDARGWKVITLEEGVYLGKARNIAAKEAQGKYILFMDDDNVAMLDEVSTFVSVFERVPSIDILTCMQSNFRGEAAPEPKQIADSVRIPLGGDVASGFFWNCFGDANHMIKRSAFEKSGGFSEDYGIGYEDYEFFAKSVLAGLRLEVVPKSLFWYRRSFDSMSFSTNLFQNRMRYLRAYTDGASPQMNNLMLFSQNLHYDQERAEAKVYNASCGDAKTCGDCKSIYNCGWCYAIGECMSGFNKSQNYNGSCTKQDGWYYNLSLIHISEPTRPY